MLQREAKDQFFVRAGPLAPARARLNCPKQGVARDDIQHHIALTMSHGPGDRVREPDNLLKLGIGSREMEHAWVVKKPNQA